MASTRIHFSCFAIVITAVVIVVDGQNVFETPAGSCRYERNVTKKDKEERFLTFSGETQRILGKRKGLELYVNFCGPIGEAVPGCDPKAFACLKRPSETIRNLGTNFQYFKDGDGQRIFRSTGGIHCADSENYTVTVEFDSMKLNSSLYVDECDVVVKMLGPNAKPPCTLRMDGRLIDLQPLRRLPEQKFVVGNDTYASTFCRPAPSCGSDSHSSCKLDGATPVPQSETQYEVIAYDYRRQELQVQRRLGHGRSRTRTDVNLKCRWDVEFGAMRTIGNNKFEAETKYGCLKMPVNCTVQDIQGYVYDLHSLDRPKGWEVRNATNLRINVCGPLRQDAPNACSDIYAQVCRRQGKTFTSYGATSPPIVEASDVLHLEFRDGSRCPKNSSLLLETKVRFECAPVETRPAVVDEVNCTLHVLWRTPAACAIANADRRKSSLQRTYDHTVACTVREDGVSYDLTPLVRNDGNYKALGPDGEEYIVNVCRTLIVGDDNYMCYGKASCMHNKTEPNFKYRYVGLGTLQVPRIVNRSVVLEYEDGYSTRYFCMRRTIVHFECSTVEKGPVFWRKEKCVHELKWQTRHACPTNVVPKSRSVRCISHKNELATFNFENSTKKQLSFEHNGKTYMFSLCQPNYTVSDNGVQTTETATVKLRYVNCTFALEYTLSGSDCKDGQLIVLLSCGQAMHGNDHYRLLGSHGCKYLFEFLSDDACKTLHNVSTPPCDLPRPNEMTTVTEAPPVLQNRNCTVGIESAKQFPLQRLDFAVVRRSKDNYTVGFARCTDGFVCRNNRSVASVNSECPNTEYDVVGSTVTLRFVGPTCGHGRFQTSVLVKCKEDDGELPTITSETKCSVAMTAPLPEICTVLTLSSTSNPATSSAALSGIIAGIVVLLASVVIILAYMYKKRWLPYRYSQVCVDKQRTRIYERDTFC